MTTIRISGASDDLVNVEGAVPGCDEYGYYGGHAVAVCFPSEDRFAVNYDDHGVWRVTHTHESGTLTVQVRKAEMGPPDDVDHATVSGVIDRVEVWREWPPPIDEVRDRIERRLDNGLTDDELRRVWRALEST